MWSYAFIIAVVAAAAPHRLRPGALIGHDGEMELVEDALWVKYPYGDLTPVIHSLQLIINYLKDVESRIWTHNWLIPSSYGSKLGVLLKLRAGTLRERAEQIVTNYHGVPYAQQNNRTKRGLADGVGLISRALFGTAMNSDVVALRRQYSQLSTLATKNARSITLVTSKVNKLTDYVNALLGWARQVNSTIEELKGNLFDIHEALEVEITFAIMARHLDEIDHTNSEVVRNIVDASLGRVTTGMFPVKDFENVLKKGKTDYSLSPVFELDNVHHYYPLVQSFLTETEIVLHVPFKSSHRFDVYRVAPFPFQLEETIIQLDLPLTHILVQNDLSSFTTVNDESVLARCKSQYKNHFFCPASLFVFNSITGESECPVALVRGSNDQVLRACPFRELAQTNYFHINLFGYHYFFLPVSMYLTVVCPNGKEARNTTGHLAVHTECAVKSTTLHTRAELMHAGFTTNHSFLIQALPDLSEVAFNSTVTLTNSLTSLNFPNLTEIQEIAQDSLPTYLEPGVHFSSWIVPMVLVLILITVLLVLFRRSLYSHNSLRNHIQTRFSELLDKERPEQ